MIQWLTADNETAKESGVRFLCRHGEQLGVPYKWNTVVSSLASSLEDDGLMLGFEDAGRIAGVMAYTFGTGEDNYVDRTRVEVHHLFIETRKRNGRMLVMAMRKLAQRLLSLSNEIKEITFYAEPTASNRQLFSKFAELKCTSVHPCGQLDFYTIPPKKLLGYANRYKVSELL